MDPMLERRPATRVLHQFTSPPKRQASVLVKPALDDLTSYPAESLALLVIARFVVRWRSVFGYRVGEP